MITILEHKHNMSGYLLLVTALHVPGWCAGCPPYIIQQLLPLIPAQRRALAWEQLGHRRSAVLPPATFRQCTLFWLLSLTFRQAFVSGLDLVSLLLFFCNLGSCRFM